MTDELLEELADLKKKYVALLREHEQLANSVTATDAQIKLAIFDHLPNPIWACDRDCKIVFWNEGATRLYGYSRDEALGKDFVKLFVNPPEQEKARVDCADIIDNKRSIKNMADDIDKHGNTKTVVTQCFPLYNIAGHLGLQVELSYEVQDVDRLKEELSDLQEKFREEKKRSDAIQKQLLEVTRQRALADLSAAFSAASESIRARRKHIETEALAKDTDKSALAKARSETTAQKQKLVQWERRLRTRIVEESTVPGLEELKQSIEDAEELDV